MPSFGNWVKQGGDKRWRRLRTDITRMGREQSGWLIKFHKYQTWRGVDLLLGKPCLFMEFNHLLYVCCSKHMGDNGIVCLRCTEIQYSKGCTYRKFQSLLCVNWNSSDHYQLASRSGCVKEKRRMCPRLTVKRNSLFVTHKIDVILWGEAKNFGKQCIPHRPSICQQGTDCHIVWASFSSIASPFSFIFKGQLDWVARTELSASL